MNDLELEDRIRTTLRAVADATPTEASGGAVRRRGRWLAAAACVAVVGAAVTVAVGSRDEARTPQESVMAVPPAATQPARFDVRTAAPVFAAPGTAREVVHAYLRSRFPDFPDPGIEVGEPVVEGETATATWSTNDSSGVIARGELLLRLVGGRWAVIAATTEGVDVHDLTYDGERVTGRVRTTDDDLLAVDVLDPSGQPLGDERPPSRSDSAYLFGTAGEGHGAVDVDAGVGPRAVNVLVRLVGGTILSVTEFRFDPPATRSVQLAQSEGTQPTWELVATEERTGHWVTLRAPGMTGTFRLQAGGPVTTPFLQLGPCCELDQHVVVAGALHRDATGLEVVLSDGTAYSAQAFADRRSGVRFAVVLVPTSAIGADGTARARIRVGDEFVESGPTFDLRAIGG